MEFAKIILMWVGIGAVLGFTYGFCRASPAAERNIKGVLSVPTAKDPARLNSKNQTIAAIRAHWLGAAIFGACIGAILGAVVGLLATFGPNWFAN
jgi:hypothetical protein